MKTKLYKVGRFIINKRDFLLRLPVGIPLLYFALHILYELLRLNLWFFRDWIVENRFYLGYAAQMFLGPDQERLWGYFGAIMAFIIIAILLFKRGVWDRMFPLLVLTDGHIEKEERRVYWHTYNTWERLWKRVLRSEGRDYNPKEYYVMVNSGGLLNPINPLKHMKKIYIDRYVYESIERESKRLYMDDVGVIVRRGRKRWMMTRHRNDPHTVDLTEILAETDSLLTIMMDETSKAAKSDTHIRKKVIMDSTFSQASSIAPELKKRIREIREKKIKMLRGDDDD